MNLQQNYNQQDKTDNEAEVWCNLLGILAWFTLAILLLIGPTILIYQHVVFGKSILVASETVQMRVEKVRKDSSKYSCVSFYDVRNDYLHGCQHTNRQTAQKYNLGEVYFVERQLWKNKQYQYYRFPEL